MSDVEWAGSVDTSSTRLPSAARRQRQRRRAGRLAHAAFAAEEQHLAVEQAHRGINNKEGCRSGNRSIPMRRCQR